MTPKVLLRGMLVLSLTVAVLGAIGLMLTPVQARANGVFDWPGAVAPCNNPASLQACVDGVLPGDVIHLLPGTYTQSVTLNKAVSLLGDGSFAVIFSAPPGQRVLSVGGPIGAGTVISGFAMRDGNLSGPACPAACGGGMLITGTARPTLRNLYFYNNYAAQQGGGLWVAAGPEVRLTGVTFYSNTSAYAGGGLYAESSVTLADNYFNQNQSTLDNGGGAYVVADLKSAGTTFYNNRAYYGGGAQVNGTAVFTGGNFTFNTANTGGGLFVSTLVITNTSFYQNSATASGGGGAWVNGEVQFADVKFQYNSAFGAGGGLYAGRLNGRGIEFSSNTSSGLSVGGGAYVYTGTNVISQALFQANTAGYNAGALYLNNGDTWLTDFTIRGNSTANSDGGAIAAFGSLQLSNGRFENNTSPGNGGAVYAASTLGVTNTRFINNTANDGSAIWHSAGDGRVVNSLFAHNLNNGSIVADLALNSSGQFTVLHSTFADPQPSISPAAISAPVGAVNVTNTIITHYAYGISGGNGAASEDYNLFFGNLNNWSGPVVTGTHSLEADPLFVDPLGGDYHLQTQSPAIDTGINVGVDFDIDGQPRPILAGYDIGFDEMGSLIQKQIDLAAPGTAINIPPGVYTESLRLWQPVSLIGGDAQTTIINALPDQRAMIISDQSVSATTIISGLTFQHGNLTGMTCPQDCGGGIFISGTARPWLQNLVLLENQAYEGGGLWTDLGPELPLINVAFISNTSQSNGGGLYASSAFRAFGGRFENNLSGQSGGGAYTPDTATLENVNFVHNSAGGDGGGAYVAYFPALVTGGTFTRNYAGGGNGGGLYAFSDAQISGTLFTNNIAECFSECSANGGGAAIYGYANVFNAAFLGNRAFYGGGLDVGAGFEINASRFINNQAQGAGGGLYSSYANAGRVVNSLFTRNNGAGSAMQVDNSSGVEVIHTTIADVTPTVDSAIVVNGTNLTLINSIVAGQAIGVESHGVVTQSYNLYFNNQVDVTGTLVTAGPILTGLDPRFANPLADDFHLRLGSPAVNQGTDAGIYTDVDGQPRPIGAGFEIGFDELFGTIQEAIDAAPPGGTVTIPPGVYNESLNLWKPVSLIGAGSGSTVINAIVGDRVLTVTGSAITPTTQIANLTLRGGNLRGGGFERGGGGVLITDTASPMFYNVVIANNLADMGGGIYVFNGGALLVNSTVAGNTAVQSGGGAYVEQPNATLEQWGGSFEGNTAVDGAGVFVQNGLFQQNGGVIFGNSASNWGGGLLIGSGGEAQTQQGGIVSNTALNLGGGVFVDIGFVDLADSAVISNTAYEGAGIYVRDMAGTSGMLRGGLVQNNRAVGYGGGAYLGSQFSITGTKFYGNSAFDGSAVEITGTASARLVNAFIGANEANGAFPSTNSSVRFDAGGSSVVLHTTFGNYTMPLTRALVVNSGVVTVANSIVASYTNGLSQFGGQLSEDYNLYYQTPFTFTGSISHGGHSLFGVDPLFKNPAVGDYHVKGFSPVVDQGTNAGVRRDIDLDARPLAGKFDIGADEASVASTTANPLTQTTFTYTTPQASTINLIVPPGAVTGTVPLYCTLVQSDTTPVPNSLSLAGFMFELNAQLDPDNDTTPGTINFARPVTLTVSYTDQQLAAAGITDESTLLLYRYESSINAWKPIGYRAGESQTLDTQHNVITAVMLGFSRFGTLGANQSQTLFLPLIMRN